MGGAVSRIGVALVFATTLLPMHAGATAGARQYRDAVGDANAITLGGNDGLDTRPASIGGADVVAAWFETTYEEVGERREATGLRLHVETAEPAAPSFGPTLAYDFYGRIGSCTLGFGMVVRGPQSRENDAPQAATLFRTDDSCPGGRGPLPHLFDLSFQGAQAVLTFPFSQTVVDGRQLLPLGATIDSDGGSDGVDVFVIRSDDQGRSYGYKSIDQADPPEPFVIGSDLPATD